MAEHTSTFAIDAYTRIAMLEEENLKLRHKLNTYQDKIEQGKMVELPCKVGDTLYAVAYKKVGAIRECIVEDIRIGYSKEVIVHFNCDNNCDDCFFNTWSQDYTGEWTCYGEWGGRDDTF